MKSDRLLVHWRPVQIALFLYIGFLSAKTEGAHFKPENFLSSNKILAGTEQRQEYEFKLAFAVKEGFSSDELKKQIHEIIIQLIQKSKFKFSKQLHSRYTVDTAFRAFVFKDIYFDTPNFDIWKSRSAYRLRYRWSRLELFLWHQILPFVRVFYPNRCEIQFKTGYIPKPKQNTMQAFETRFEFRNESHPFVEKKDAPGAPWPEKEFIRYALSGYFRDYRMKPMSDLVHVIGKKKRLQSQWQIAPVLKVITVRDRIHVGIKNPWGALPNPDQVFIVTIDRSEVFRASDPWAEGKGPVFKKSHGAILEVEIELDRNTYTEIQKAQRMSEIPVLGHEVIAEAILASSKEAENNLHKDLDILKKHLAGKIASIMETQALPLDYKYARIMKILEDQLQDRVKRHL